MSSSHSQVACCLVMSSFVPYIQCGRARASGSRCTIQYETSFSFLFDDETSFLVAGTVYISLCIRTLFLLHPLMYHRFFFPSMCCRRTVRARSNKQQLYRTSLSSFFLGPAAYCPSIRYCSTFVAFFFLSKSDAPTFLTIKKVDAAPFSFRVE